MFTRRQFVFTAGALAATPFLPRSAFGRRLAPRQFADVPLKATELTTNIWAITEGGGNSLLVKTSDGVILIDTKITKFAKRLQEKTIEVAGGAPTTIINTHHHFDHTGGNYIFDPSTDIVAHRNLKPRLQSSLDERVKPAMIQEAETQRKAGKPELAEAIVKEMEKLTAADFAPDTEYDKDLKLDLGGVKLELRHYGNGHTDNDTIIFLPDHNILVMGDLFFHNMHPFIDRPAKAETKGWQNSVREAMKLGDAKTTTIPGHGEVTQRGSLQKQLDYFDQLRAIVTKAMKEGKSKETIATMQPEEFKTFGFQQLQSQALGATYEEIAEETH
jgi:cyclase